MRYPRFTKAEMEKLFQDPDIYPKHVAQRSAFDLGWFLGPTDLESEWDQGNLMAHFKAVIDNDGKGADVAEECFDTMRCARCELPLRISGTHPYVSAIAKWRLRVGK